MHIKSEFNWSIAWFNMETSLNSVFIRSTLHYAYGFCVMKLRRSVKDNERKWNYDSSAILKSTTLQTSYNLFWLSSVEAYQLVLGAFHQADVLHGVCRASEGGSEGTTLPHSPPPGSSWMTEWFSVLQPQHVRQNCSCYVVSLTYWSFLKTGSLYQSFCDHSRKNVCGNWLKHFLEILYYDHRNFDSQPDICLTTVAIEPATFGIWFEIGSSTCNLYEHEGRFSNNKEYIFSRINHKHWSHCQWYDSLLNKNQKRRVILWLGGWWWDYVCSESS
jgi:hypothetical protein